MRRALFALALTQPLALALGAATASAQVRIGVHIDLPIVVSGRPVIVHRPAPPPPRYVNVYDYSSRDFGRWDRDARRWLPVTLYLWEGRYYEVPVEHARPVHLFQYRDRYFFEPRDRDWNDYRDHVLRPRYDDRNDSRDYRNDQNGRDDRDYRDGQDNRNDRDTRNDRDNRDGKGAPVRARPRPQ